MKSLECGGGLEHEDAKYHEGRETRSTRRGAAPAGFFALRDLRASCASLRRLRRPSCLRVPDASLRRLRRPSCLRVPKHRPPRGKITGHILERLSNIVWGACMEVQRQLKSHCHVNLSWRSTIIATCTRYGSLSGAVALSESSSLNVIQQTADSKKQEPPPRSGSFAAPNSIVCADDKETVLTYDTRE
jgi:hypothetical protein